MKVVLIQAPVWGIYEPPIGLSQISSCLKNEGHTAHSLDLNIELYNATGEEYRSAWAIEQSSFWYNENYVSKFLNDNLGLVQDFVQEIVRIDPDIVGFSVNSASRISSLKIAKMIKNRNASIKVVFGGHMFLIPETDVIKEILDSNSCDFIVCGEGEVAFIELIECLKSGAAPSKCKGVCFKHSSKIMNTGERDPMKNLDEIPFLDFQDMPFEKYHPPGHLENHISFQSSRGCPWRCVFCGSKPYWKGYRVMSGRRIYEEIRYHIEKNPRIEHVEFLDLLFNGSMRTLEEFCDLMIESPPKGNLAWHANAIIRPEMTDEVCKKMKYARCSHLTYGIESGSQKILDLMGKRYKISDADKVLRATHEAGITVTCNFMFGFPGEDEEDFGKTLDFLGRNANHIDVAYPSRTYCTIEPGSYLESHLGDFGMVPNPAHGQYWESEDGKNTYPERMRRCEIFSNHAQSLGINIGLGLGTSIEQDKYLNLGTYHESKKDYQKALGYFKRYLELDPENKVVSSKVKMMGLSHE